MNPLRRPINCYHHRTRYNALIFLNITDAITFIIRLILVCVELSKSQDIQFNVTYPVIIFLLELLSTLPLFISNFVYCVLCCFKHEVFHDDRHPVCCHRRTALRVAAFTCFPCQCYRDHPPSIQFTRVVILAFFYVIRCIAVVTGAFCATNYKSRCVPYTVISSIVLVPSFLTLVVEWLHFHLLWNFQPNIGDSLTKRRDRSHLRFISDKLVNEERILDYDRSLCKDGERCGSNSLTHTILYHSHQEMRAGNDQQIIAYYVTRTANAIDIAQNGFPVDRYRQVDPDIYFTRSVETWNNIRATDLDAVICVRLSLGHVLKVQHDEDLRFSRRNTQPHLAQTLESIASGKIKVRFPGQIGNWIIVVRTDDSEGFDTSYYDGCL